MTNEKMPLAVAPFRGEPMVYISDALAAIEAATLKERERCELIAANNVSVITVLQLIRRGT